MEDMQKYRTTIINNLLGDQMEFQNLKSFHKIQIDGLLKNGTTIIKMY